MMNTNKESVEPSVSGTLVESPMFGDFAKIMTTGNVQNAPHRLKMDAEKTKDGLAQLVLTVIKLLHELLEKQAIHRIDGGSLTDEEIERLGITLMRQSEVLTKIAQDFGLDDEDLNLDLGPLGRLI